MSDTPKKAVIGYAIVGLDYIGTDDAEYIEGSSGVIIRDMDWTASMRQTFEYYTVDPSTWKDVSRIENVIDSSINWDSSADTLGSATINICDSLPECYIRIYLITVQNGVRRKHPLGTFLVQTPSFKFDGKTKNISLDAYTPLLELKENHPPIGYSIAKGTNILEITTRLVREQARAPIYQVDSTDTLYSNFVSSPNDTWIVFLKDLLMNAGKKGYRFGLDELGRIIFLPNQDIKSLQPVWTYTDDNSSILYPSLDMDHDLYGIPNVVEVVYSEGAKCFYGIAVNDDPSSPTSTVNRGRKITHRVVNPGLPGIPNQAQIEQYAQQTLRDMSTLEYTITYTHGYCPVRIGDCVRLNYKKAGLYGVKAKVISQTINCTPGCPVTEKATFTSSLWKG